MVTEPEYRRSPSGRRQGVVEDILIEADQQGLSDPDRRGAEIPGGAEHRLHRLIRGAPTKRESPNLLSFRDDEQ